MSNMFATLDDESIIDIIGKALADTERDLRSELREIKQFVGMPIPLVKSGPGLVRPSLDDAAAERVDSELCELLRAAR